MRNIAYFASFTLFIALLWVGLSIYHNFSTSTISSDENIQINPISDSFNISAIEVLKKKEMVTVDLSQRIMPAVSSGSAVIKPTPTVIRPTPTGAAIYPSPVISPAVVSPSPVASGSGNIRTGF
ncbi:MAG: hypothetical protein ACM3IJ_06340 [Candidatus Levyibacteriota bacterium]